MKHIVAGLFCIGFLLGNVHAKLVGHWHLSPTKPVRIEWDADRADANTWRDGGATNSGPSNVSIVTLPNGDKVWEQNSNKHVFSSALIPVDPSKRYRLSGTFRSTGSIDSKIYFGFLPILDDGTNSNQTPSHWTRTGDDGIIQSWNDTTISLANNINGWYTSSTWYGNRFMGFYYDGDTASHPPDTIMYSTSYGTDRGAFTSVLGSTINISYPLPSSITDNLIPGVSVVKNHYSGAGTYLYSVLIGNILPQTWNTYSDISTGDGWTQPGPKAFRPFTRFVRIMMLLNYSQTSTSTIQFDKIILEEVQGDETSTDGSYKIYDNAPLYGLAINSRHHGGNHGAIFSEGPNGATRGAMSFNGTSSYIGDIESVNILEPSSISVSSWINMDTNAPTARNIWLTKWFGYSCEITDTTRIPYFRLAGAGDIVSNTALTLGTWHHFVGTYNPSIGGAVYLDGTLVGTKGPSGAITHTRDFPLNIGRYYEGIYFKGKISDVRIYDHALSQEEITNLYSEKQTTFTSTASITTKNTNKTAIPKLLYWDLASKQYWVGQTDGSLQRVSAPISSFKNTTELTTIQTGKTATNGQLYWDTQKKKYFIGQPNGDLRPLSE